MIPLFIHIRELSYEPGPWLHPLKPPEIEILLNSEALVAHDSEEEGKRLDRFANHGYAEIAGLLPLNI
jgi:hypothetical protein